MKKNVLAILFIVGWLSVNAQDRLFTYTYQSGVLSKGQKEIEVWTTLRTIREQYYKGLDHRMEFEIGLGVNLQTSFYLNYGYATGIVDNNGVSVLGNTNVYSFSNEWKLKLSDPAANAVGSALYFEYLLSPVETELEGKLIFDRQSGSMMHALNLTCEYEIEKQFPVLGNKISDESEGEFKFEFNYALAFSVNNNMHIGVEARNYNVLSNSSVWEYSVLSAGPCFSYKTDGFWINFTLMPQIVNLKGGGLELTENEKLQTRLIFSYGF